MCIVYSTNTFLIICVLFCVSFFLLLLYRFTRIFDTNCIIYNYITLLKKGKNKIKKKIKILPKPNLIKEK